MDQVAVLYDGGVLVDDHGRIAAVGPSNDIERLSQGATIQTSIDAKGKCLLPGLVDGHTHPVWSGNRCHEFKLKLAGASYLEIHKIGGGIGYTAKCTASATEEELTDLVVGRLKRMLRFGTTTCEVKSGYGFDIETELKELRVLKKAEDLQPISLVSTFLGGHSVPPGTTSAAHTKLIVEAMLPKVLEEKEKGLNNVSCIDVFCEKGVYDQSETKAILEAGKSAGLLMNFHGDELNPMQCGELAGEIGAHCVSHCEHVTEEGIAAMAKKPTFAVLLPTTAYVLRIAPPPARRLIEGNVPIALGSDFCPNAHSVSMPNAMNLACVLMRMTMNEALVAATINAAASLGKSDVCGSIEVGKWGDLLLLDAPLWEHIIYEMVDPPIEAVFKMGKEVYRRQE